MMVIEVMPLRLADANRRKYNNSMLAGEKLAFRSIQVLKE